MWQLGGHMRDIYQEAGLMAHVQTSRFAGHEDYITELLLHWDLLFFYFFSSSPHTVQ